MTSVHLPVAHTQDDLEIAAALAKVLGSRELYVAWSTDGGTARPVIDAILEFEVPPPARMQPATLWQRLLDYWRTR